MSTASTVNINELPSGSLVSTNKIIHAASDGLAKTSSMSELASFIEVVTSISFKGDLAMADTPSEDGFYFASETGTYTNAGGLVTDLTEGLNIIVVTNTQTTFEKIVMPLTQPTLSEVTSSRRNIAVNEAAVYDEFANLFENLRYPFARTATLDLDDNVKKGVRDVCIKSGELTGDGFHLRVARNVSSEWIVEIRTGTTVLCQYLSTTKPVENSFDIITLSEFGSSGIEAYVQIKWDEITEGIDNLDSSKYKLNDTSNLLNTEVFEVGAATWTSFTGASVDGFTAEAPTTGVKVASSDSIDVTTGQVVNIKMSINLVSGSNPILTFRHNGTFQMLTITSGEVNQNVTILGDDTNAYVQVQYNSGSGGSIVVSNTQVKTSGGGSVLLGFDSSKYIKPLVEIEIQTSENSDIRNNKNTNHLLSVNQRDFNGYTATYSRY